MSQRRFYVASFAVYITLNIMETVSNHTHLFAPIDWPFEAPTNAVAYTNQRVLREDYLVLLVSHDNDGDWQFLCGSDDPGACLIVCLACAFERDRTVGLVADLPVGWQAWRESVNDHWHRAPREDDANDV